jgi:MFS family permease
MSTYNSKRLPPAIWALGFVSLFMDISSEMMHSVLPLFLVGVLGASASTLGLIEGLAESVACLTKLFSGVISDRWGRRKPLALVGYGMAALTKPLFPIADSAATVLFARFMDRIGKGIRGAPRDALVADLTLPEQRGAAYGLRQSLDTVGAFLGPALATALLLLWAGNLRSVMWVAVIPAFIAVGILAIAVREPEPASRAAARANPFAGFRARRFPPAFWFLIGIVALFTMARFSEAFLLLRAQDAGLPLAFVPAVLVLMNLVYAASAYPAGRWADRAPRLPILMTGCAVLIVADILLSMADTLPLIGIGVSLWGLHMGLTEGLFAALVAEHTPPELRATGFGVMNLVRGLLLLPASSLAGWLWTHQAPSAVFATGALFALLSLIALWLWRALGRS